jgi:hemolysin activation/secretion protein
LARNLMLANDSNAKNLTVTFKRNNATGLADAVVKLTAEDPQRWLALLDNTGNASTGAFRSGLIYQHGNLFNRDHALSLQLMTSPGYWNQVGIIGLGYRIPFYGLGASVDLSASYSSVDSGKVASAGGGPDLAISGGGKTFGIRYTHLLDTVSLDAGGQFQQRVSAGIEQRNFSNSVTLVGGSAASLVPDLATRPLTLGYSATWREAARDGSVSLQWTQNLPGSTHGSTADFNLPGGRAGANDGFKAVKYTLQHTEHWASQWSLRAALNGQLSRDLLISPEQFGVGGNDSVRGFGEREVAGDQGVWVWRSGHHRWTAAPGDWCLWPLRTPPASSATSPPPAKLRNKTSPAQDWVCAPTWAAR